jgi:LmbE family N-acetylglucosaminyl deacetylase
MRERCLVVAPHPDDETIGAGIWMHRHRHLGIHILHVTDGSPRDLQYARAAGFQSRRAYASARRRELHNALRLTGVDRSRLRVFSYVDKETWLHLAELAGRLAELIAALRPNVVLSPAYEGGHPDHDSTAFAVHMARRVSGPFIHREYTLYHADHNGAMVTGEFLPGQAMPEEILNFTSYEQNRKRRMLASFNSQQDILQHFTPACERFRDAPPYDFTRPPHEGTLLYERWCMGITGAAWLSRAKEALTVYERIARRDGGGSL